MGIPGINSILFAPADRVWRGETSPTLELADLINAIPEKIRVKQFKAAADMLDRLAQFNLQPSQHMRRHYLEGCLAAAQEDWESAFDAFDAALRIAEPVADYDSMIELISQAAGALHNLLHYDKALDFYRIAYETWQEKTKDLYMPPIESEVALITDIGRQQWLVGSHDEAHTTIARALALAMHDTRTPISNDLNQTTANALWMLALVLRAQSDMRDGDEGYLEMARERMSEALRRNEAVGAMDNQLGRLYVQLAEITLDLAELSLMDNAVDTARVTRLRGLRQLQMAENYLTPSSDESGKMLRRMVRCRADILWLRPRSRALDANSAHDTLSVIEQDAALSHDRFLIARAATLRAEWYIALGDTESARHWLRWALKGYHQGGMGMATRAQRLLRRLTNEPPHADWPQRSSSGPLPDPLIPPKGDIGSN